MLAGRTTNYRTRQFLERELNNGYETPSLVFFELTKGHPSGAKANQILRAERVLRREVLDDILQESGRKLHGITRVVVGFRERRPKAIEGIMFLGGNWQEFAEAYEERIGKPPIPAHEPFSLERSFGRLVSREFSEIGYGSGKAMHHVEHYGWKSCEFDVLAVGNSEAITKLVGRLLLYGLKPVQRYRNA